MLSRPLVVGRFRVAMRGLVVIPAHQITVLQLSAEPSVSITWLSVTAVTLTQTHVHAASFEQLQRRLAQAGTEFGITQYPPDVLGGNIWVQGQQIASEPGHLGGELHPGIAGADNDERQGSCRAAGSASSLAVSS